MNADLLSKLTKMIRLADQGSEGERDNALEMAQRLAAKAGVDLAMVRVRAQKVEEADRPQEIIKGEAKLQKTIDAKHFITRLLQSYFGVRVVYHGGTKGEELTFVGEVGDVQFSQFLFGWLEEEFERRWKAYRKAKAQAGTPLGNTSERKAYFAGLSAALSSKLHQAQQEAEMEALAQIPTPVSSAGTETEERPMPTREAVRQEMALMVVQKEERVQAKMDQFFPILRRSRGGSRGFGYGRQGAIQAGRRDGANINIPGKPLN